MAHDFDKLRNRMTPERRECIDRMAQEMFAATINGRDEYLDAVRRLAEANARIAQREKELEETGLSPDEIKRVLDPIRSFYLQLGEEIERYKGRG
ncbi:MAG: hypothetical protein GC162_19735 [Planctomycetes bacterium]|nr:hypothetical protein [Planctomycetota bacterium]